MDKCNMSMHICQVYNKVNNNSKINCVKNPDIIFRNCDTMNSWQERGFHLLSGNCPDMIQFYHNSGLVLK
jgi:hypothetical protein